MNYISKQEINGRDQILGIAKRRKKILILTPILVIILSGFLLYVLPKQYKSSATILAKKSQTLNPLISYQMAVQVANQNQLSTINQIIYSRTSINMLIDSLDLAKPEITDEDREVLIKNVKKDVIVIINQENIFTIEYIDENPQKAKQGVELLIRYFIDTDQKMRNEQNLETVRFFQQETEHLKNMLEKTRAERLSTIKKRVNSDPVGSNTLQARFNSLNTEISNTISDISHFQQQSQLLDSLKNDVEYNDGDALVFMKLDLGNLPYGSNLQDLLQNYMALKQTYTNNYPVVKSLKNQITDIVDQIPSALSLKIDNIKKKKEKLEATQKDLIGKIEKKSVAQGVDKSQADYYGVYQSLYNDMNVKLEQAEVNYQLGKNSKKRFVVIDPAIVPSKPSKPKGKLILAGGFLIGIFLAVVTAAAAEILDTTVQDPDDLAFYDKPIIAFLPEGKP